MVYDFTLSDIPKKDFCHHDLSHVKAIGFWRKERIIIIKQIKNLTETTAVPTHQVVTAKNKNPDRNNSCSDPPGRNSYTKKTDRNNSCFDPPGRNS